MKLFILGDLHGNTGWAQDRVRLAKKLGCEFIIQLGDLGIWPGTSGDAFLRKLNKTLVEEDIDLLFVDGNHECVSVSTRACTKSGFKYFWELVLGEEILSIDDNGFKIWLPIEEIIVKDFDGELVEVSSRGFNMQLTPGHRFIYKDRKNRWAEKFARELKPFQAKIPVAVLNDNSDSNVPDDMLRLYAWCITDGHHRAGGGWHLYQRESSAYRVIELLDRLNISHSISERTRNVQEICGKKVKSVEPETTIRIPVGEGRKLPWNKLELWPELWNCSSRQFEVFIEEFVYCDGSWSSDGKQNAAALYINEPRRLEEIQRLCLLNGWRSTPSVFRGNDSRLNICRSSTLMTHRETSIRNVSYKGKVWCVRVANGRWMAENEGFTFATGNCFPKLERLRKRQKGIAPLILSSSKSEGISRIKHIPRGHVWELNGKRLGGFGGAYSIDKQWRVPGKSWWPQETITDEQMDDAKEDWLKGLDVMFTHDCPTNFPMKNMKNDPESHIHRQRIDVIGNWARPKLWFHGHMHEFREYEFGYTPESSRVIGLECDAMRYDWSTLDLAKMHVRTAEEFYMDKKRLDLGY